MSFVQSAGGFLSSSALTLAVTINPSVPGNVLLAYIHAAGAGKVPTGVTDTAGNSWERVGSVRLDAATMLEVWRTELKPSSLSTTQVTATFDQADNHSLLVVEYSKVLRYGASASAGPTTSTAPSLALTALEASDVAYAFLFNNNGGIAATGGTERQELLNTTSIITVAAYDRSGGPGSVTGSGTITSAAWAAIAVELQTSVPAVITPKIPAAIQVRM